MAKVALITGILGQDGPYLAQLLLSKKYKVFGMVQPKVQNDFSNLEYLGIRNKCQYVPGDMRDEASIAKVIKRVKPNEIYNLAAQSFVGTSWGQAKLTTEINALGVLYLLNAVKKLNPTIKFYQASTSEMFGHNHNQGIQKEDTPFHPRSPYAISKLYAYWITNNYKESYGMFCCNGILFNHESPIRGEAFVTRKISLGAAKIKLGLSNEIRLGNIDSRRDWGFAGDYVEAMWLMMQHRVADNYIISTGRTHSIKDFLDIAFNHVGIKQWKKYIKIDPTLRRPIDLPALHGRSSKAQKILGWKPKVGFRGLVAMMVDADLARLRGKSHT